MDLASFAHLRANLLPELCRHIHNFCEQITAERHQLRMRDLKIQTRVGMVVFGGYELTINATLIPDIAAQLVDAHYPYFHRRMMKKRHDNYGMTEYLSDRDYYIGQMNKICLLFADDEYIACTCAARVTMSQEKFVNIVTDILSRDETLHFAEHNEHRFAKNLDIIIS